MKGFVGSLVVVVVMALLVHHFLPGVWDLFAQAFAEMQAAVAK